MKPRRLLDPFFGARTVRYFSHFGTHLSRVPEKFSSFLSSAYNSQISQPLCFDIHTKCPGVYPHPRMFLRDFPIEAPPQLWSEDPDRVGTFQRSDVQTRLLLLSKLKAPINPAESTFPKVLILRQFKVPLEPIRFEKQGEGSPLWLTKC